MSLIWIPLLKTVFYNEVLYISAAETEWLTNHGIRSSEGTGNKSLHNVSNSKWWYWNGTNWKQPINSSDIVIQSKCHSKAIYDILFVCNRGNSHRVMAGSE